jgi:hypothetical protein
MKHSFAVITLAALGAVACGSDKPAGAKPHAASHDTDDAGKGDSWSDSDAAPGLALDQCGLSTGFAGDALCILPPPPDKGFQLHVGPDDYDNPDELYMLAPGEEKTDDIPAVSSNDSDIYFFYRQYRLRPSAHHIIITAANGTDVVAGRRIGTANLSEDYPTGGVIAPEDKGVGLPLAAHAAISSNFHAINTTDQPALREAWINFWYRDASEVTQPATEWFETGDITFSIPPHTSQTLGPYTCNIDNDGRLLWMYGHRHANNTRFTATRIRGDARDVIYDADKWDEPLLLEYSSLVKNTAPDIPTREGGWSGILDLSPGDKIEWKCDVVNNHDTALRFTNQTLLGEMCIVDAEAVGANCGF